VFLSNEPLEWPASSWQGHACDVVKTHNSAAAQRRPRGPGPHKGLQQLPAASLQEAWLQKLLQHLPALCHTPPLQHTVSATAGAPCSFPPSQQQCLCTKRFPLQSQLFSPLFLVLFEKVVTFAKLAALAVIFSVMHSVVPLAAHKRTSGR